MHANEMCSIFKCIIVLQVLVRALTHCDNVYQILNYRAVGRVCRTNLPPNTAFRGFGAPQAMVITEQWMQRVAEHLKLPPEKVRRAGSAGL